MEDIFNTTNKTIYVVVEKDIQLVSVELAPGLCFGKREKDAYTIYDTLDEAIANGFIDHKFTQINE